MSLVFTINEHQNNLCKVLVFLGFCDEIASVASLLFISVFVNLFISFITLRALDNLPVKFFGNPLVIFQCDVTTSGCLQNAVLFSSY